MKKKYLLAPSLALAMTMASVPAGVYAQGWPAEYDGVMLQGFYWDSYIDTQWANLEKQADEISQYFSLVWIPNSGFCGTANNMGYMPLYYFDQNSSFGSEAQLRSMIAAYRERGTGMVADVVINHRNNLGANGSWSDFPEESYKGREYTMRTTDICRNDDGGKTASWAAGKGLAVSENNDTGDDWSGCRDLDHKSANVNKVVKAYLDYLLNDLGYAGFRYDMVKGYGASFTADYNRTVGVRYSVGEYWDGNAAVVKRWIDGTKTGDAIQSAAFDFAFRYTCRDAVRMGNNGSYSWGALLNNSVMDDEAYRRYAVTFVENHDTEYRSSTAQQDPIRRDTLALNAWMMANPGTPCVFMRHWMDCKQQIKAMIDARKAAGITNQSTFENGISETSTNRDNGYLLRTIHGRNADLCVAVGSFKGIAPEGYTEILSGLHYRYFLGNGAEIPFVDRASGEYGEAFEVMLAAVSGAADARLVYTLDGSTPTSAHGTVVASGARIGIEHDCELKVGLLVDGKVTASCGRSYRVKSFQPHKATVYLRNPAWSSIYFYAWDGKGALLGNWPGTLLTKSVIVNGEEWYAMTFDVKAADYSFNIIFNQGSGKLQTIDIGPLSEDTFYEIAELSGGKYTVNDVTSRMSLALDDICQDKASCQVQDYYDLWGRRVPAGAIRNGRIYLHDGRRFMVR